MAGLATFDTVATFSDKKNNNAVTINIALNSLKPKSSQKPDKPQQQPQPNVLRVDKATITDPSYDDEDWYQDQEGNFYPSEKPHKKRTSRLFSVLAGIKNVFTWTTSSIGGSIKSSESFMSDSGLRRSRLGEGYVKLSREAEDNGSASKCAYDHRYSAATDSHLSSPISEMDEDSDYSWDDEELTCNVCDRAFDTPHQLEYHQQKKRHWGCNACDTLFSTLTALEHHKELFEHWSDDEYVSSTEDEEFDEYTNDGKVAKYYEFNGSHHHIMRELGRRANNSGEFANSKNQERALLFV